MVSTSSRPQRQSSIDRIIDAYLFAPRRNRAPAHTDVLQRQAQGTDVRCASFSVTMPYLSFVCQALAEPHTFIVEPRDERTDAYSLGSSSIDRQGTRTRGMRRR